MGTTPLTLLKSKKSVKVTNWLDEALLTPSSNFVNETTQEPKGSDYWQASAGNFSLEPTSRPNKFLGDSDRSHPQTVGPLMEQRWESGTRSPGLSPSIPNTPEHSSQLKSLPPTNPTQLATVRLSEKAPVTMYDEVKTKWKGRRLLSKSAHWIEIQERTGGFYKVSLRDVKKAACIKAQRNSKGLKKASHSEEQADSDSSWRMKVAEPYRTSQQPQVSVSLASASVSLTSRVRLISDAIGLVLREDLGETAIHGKHGSLPWSCWL